MAAAKFKPVDEQLAYLRKGVAEIIREDELKAKLEKSAKEEKPLRVYLGVDPTAPDIHLGHTVVLRKLKQFQDMGYTAIFLIGDFSAMIGDPTGQSETRPPLSREQVDANAQTYLEQVYKILDREKTEARYNSEWLGKLSSFEIVQLCGKYRLARMLEREDFRSRLDKNLPISVHELLYPLLTAYDAVALKSDIELGATGPRSKPAAPPPSASPTRRTRNGSAAAARSRKPSPPRYGSTSRPPPSRPAHHRKRCSQLDVSFNLTDSEKAPSETSRCVAWCRSISHLTARM